MKVILKYISLVLFVCAVVIGVNYKYPNHLDYINDKIVDIFFNSKNDNEIGTNIVIIDIDDKSLSEVGQWPWSRNKMGQLVENLNTLSPSCIGYGIIFSEEDRTSPSQIGAKDNGNLENYDETFAKMIENSNTPVVLGYNFLDERYEGEKHETPYIPAIIKNTLKNDQIGFYKAANTLLNIQGIQDSAYSSGFLNSITNENGRITSMPLVMEYKDQLFPSLSLELVRTIYGARELKIGNEKNMNQISFAEIKVPVDTSGSMFVNYINSPTGFKHISAVDILNKNFNNFLLSDVSSKIVLIGSTAVGLSQVTPTPFNTNISSIDLQATVIENILSGKYLTKPDWEKFFQYGATIVISMLILAAIFFNSALVNGTISLFIAIASYFILQKMFIENGFILNTTYIIETILLSLTSSVIVHFMKNNSDMVDIKGKFASKVSKAVMEDLLENKDRKGDLSAKRKIVTIFFSDIKGFTKITETINDPDMLTRYINRYMDAMTKSIMISEGTVDKFMGDAIMAYWNAPYDVEDHADKALTSALEQFELLKEINVENQKEGLPKVEIRIGLNYGEVFVGEVGGELRSDYTIMGKAVNHTSVLEQISKFYGSDIIISQSVKENLKKQYTMLLIDKIKVDGTNDAFDIYQVFKKGAPDEFVQDEIEKFERGVLLYREGKLDDAILIFRNLYLQDNLLNKRLCNIYIDRCEIGAITQAGGDFNPIQAINKSIISNS
ncbi:MAG: adenylate/guanylate cyclase domain-containing protein [Arcobacteraceae bacterium]|nr:adenylate/guanylate cyclase domain-containing protein [Arcobacteraceae bacterium]